MGGNRGRTRARSLIASWLVTMIAWTPLAARAECSFESTFSRDRPVGTWQLVSGPAVVQITETNNEVTWTMNEGGVDVISLESAGGENTADGDEVGSALLLYNANGRSSGTVPTGDMTSMTFSGAWGCGSSLSGNIMAPTEVLDVKLSRSEVRPALSWNTSTMAAVLPSKSRALFVD